jgi:hypothetical protein
MISAKSFMQGACGLRIARALLLALAVAASACGHNPTGPSLPDCAYYDTGDLILTNQAVTLTPRDIYIDGHFITVLPFGNQTVVSVSAGVIHTVEWVSTLGGGLVGSTRLVVDQCTATSLTNYN